MLTAKIRSAVGAALAAEDRFDHAACAAIAFTALCQRSRVVSLLRTEFLEAGISSLVEYTRFNRGDDCTTGVTHVAAIAESAICNNTNNILEHVRNGILAGRQLKFSYARVIHQDATSRQ